MTFSIRTVLLFGFGGLLAISLIIVSLVGVLGAGRNTLTLLASQSEQMVAEAERHLIAALQPIEDQGAFLASEFASGRLDFDHPERLTLVMEASVAAVPDLAGMVVLDARGVGYRYLGSRRDGALDTIAEVDFRTDSRFGNVLDLAKQSARPVWRRPFWAFEVAQTVINLHTPLFHNGEFVGLVIQGRTVADLSIRLRQLQEGADKVPFLLYGRDHVLAHPVLADGTLSASFEEPLPTVVGFSDPVMAGFAHLEPARFTTLSRSERTKIGHFHYEEHGYLFSYQEVAKLVADVPIIVGIYVNEDRYADLTDRLWYMVVTGLVILLIATIISLKLAKYTILPIRALSVASSHVATGDLDSVPPLMRSRFRELDDAARAFESMIQGMKEHRHILNLFGRVMPKKVADRMLQSDDDLAPQLVVATVVFCDLAEFTKMTVELGPERVVNVLNAYFTDMVEIVHDYDGIVTQFQGDAILAVFNLPIADPDHAAKAVAAARDMRAHLKSRSYEGQILSNRIGIATGPMIAANVGAATRMNYTVHGDTVNLAARLENMNKDLATDILISHSTASAIGFKGLVDLGDQEIRGHNQPERVYTIAEGG